MKQTQIRQGGDEIEPDRIGPVRLHVGKEKTKKRKERQRISSRSDSEFDSMPAPTHPPALGCSRCYTLIGLRRGYSRC
ncbi:hypothetical protein CDL15_Pgr018899 [Punica granatum]|uniref:Uncharacterized protein n=1 Tax=Punica granatum TaxID=22663 RepID=A0A218WMY0_PUNGR|nr:hypothetical protein CDL15_Pgr018899 [Punica granatum]